MSLLLLFRHSVASVSPSGLPSVTVFGTPTVLAQPLVSPTGLPSVKAFGVPTVLAQPLVSPSGLPSVTAFGIPALRGQLLLSPSGLSSVTLFGVPQMIEFGITVTETGVFHFTTSRLEMTVTHQPTTTRIRIR